MSSSVQTALVAGIKLKQVWLIKLLQILLTRTFKALKANYYKVLEQMAHRPISLKWWKNNQDITFLFTQSEDKSGTFPAMVTVGAQISSSQYVTLVHELKLLDMYRDCSKLLNI